MKTQITEINRETFEDVLFNPNLIVVQKNSESNLEYTTSLYVYTPEQRSKPIEVYVRLIDTTGTFFWKEIL